MALNNVGLGFIFTARDLASAKMAQVERQFSSLDEQVTGGTARMSSAFAELGVGMAAFTAGAAVLAGSFALASAAGRFEQGLAAVGAVTRATAEQMRMLRHAAVEAGAITQFSPTEAVEGLQSLATAGQTAEQATRTLLPVLDLAAGSLGQLGVAQAAEAVVGTLNAYGISADEAASVTDQLLRITQLTNFQTRDFEAGLAKAAAAGSVFGQDLNDVLITMGLLRNRNIDASSSSTAFRESVRRVGAETRAQQVIMETGVDIFDQQSGRMRSLVDIMTDFAGATADLSEEERNHRIVTAFGARGLLAFNAILNASFTTMRDGREITLQGAEAIEALREQMMDAGGTANAFRETLLDTFEGQKVLLRGIVQTLAVVLGEPFSAVFKPIVAAVATTLSGLIRVVQAVPDPIKRAIAGFIVGAGALVTLVGGLIMAKAGFALLMVGIKLLGVTMGSLFAMVWPAVLVIGVLGLTVATLVAAYKHNIGGFADAIAELVDRVRLVFAGLSQLFDDGGFSGAVREELNRAENQGLKRFVISLWQVAYRIRAIGEGLWEGFVAALEEAQPVFASLGLVFQTMFGSLAEMFGMASGGAASLPSASFREFGAAIGHAIGWAVTWFLRLWSVSARITAGIVAGFRGVSRFLGPAIMVVGEAVMDLVRAWQRLTSTQRDGDGSVRDSRDAWISLGSILGSTIGGAVTFVTLALGGLIRVLEFALVVLHGVKTAFIAVGTWIGETAAALYLWFVDTLPGLLSQAWDAIGAFFTGMGTFFQGVGEAFTTIFAWIADGIRSFLSPVVSFFQGVGRAIAGVFDGIRDRIIRILREVPSALLPDSLERFSRQTLSTERGPETDFESLGEDTVASFAAPTLAAMPSLAEASSRASEFGRLEAGLQELSRRDANSPDRSQPLQIQLQVDGETIARATANATADAAARSFSPIPAY